MDLIPIANPNAVGLGVGRRMKDDPDFPRVYHINGRNYIDGAELAAYKQRLIQRAVAEPPHPSHGEAADSP